ncbi:MarR family winged helix-turn-helix transcriptional regulator [Dactylosporangium sp. CA-092794]|uniref:MarR family winged helix-turn-helix transcriptional regulator n=1 Tax=Dactylosporangium sp. CA-092794 TaxID=3239929 RepID=UPI003D8CCD45
MIQPENTSQSLLESMRWIGWAQRKAAEDVFRARELSFEQGFALTFLVQNPGVIQRDLARMTRTTAGAVSSLLQGLERRGLVERRMEPGDDRSKRLYATPTGIDLIAGVDTAMDDVQETILRPLSQPERAALQALLAKVTAELPRQPRP